MNIPLCPPPTPPHPHQSSIYILVLLRTSKGYLVHRAIFDHLLQVFIVFHCFHWFSLVFIKITIEKQGKPSLVMMRECPCSTKTREGLGNPSPPPSRFPLVMGFAPLDRGISLPERPLLTIVAWQAVIIVAWPSRVHRQLLVVFVNTNVA